LDKLDIYIWEVILTQHNLHNIYTTHTHGVGPM